jgi:hypothetical protein
MNEFEKYMATESWVTVKTRDRMQRTIQEHGKKMEMNQISSTKEAAS